MNGIVCAYIRWRYGGDVADLKPPLGYHPVYSKVSLWYKLRYHLWQYPRWCVEKVIFKKWGQPMRDRRRAEWERLKAMSTERLMNDL